MAISPFVYRIADRKNIFTSEYIIIFRNISQSFFRSGPTKNRWCFLPQPEVSSRDERGGFCIGSSLSIPTAFFRKEQGEAVFPHSHIPVHFGDAEEKGIFSLSLPPPSASSTAASSSFLKERLKDSSRTGHFFLTFSITQNDGEDGGLRVRAIRFWHFQSLLPGMHMAVRLFRLFPGWRKRAVKNADQIFCGRKVRSRMKGKKQAVEGGLPAGGPFLLSRQKKTFSSLCS
jgi:hypothetical protein